MVASLLTSCVNRDEAKTRKEQEKAFTSVFGFRPSPEVSEIYYRSESSWFFHMSGWEDLMKFTYIEHIFEKIVHSGGFTIEATASSQVNDAPDWWKDSPPGSEIYRTDNDGIIKLIWTDKSEEYIYYQECSVD